MLSTWPVRGVAWMTRNFHALPARWRCLRWLETQTAMLARVPPRTVRFASHVRMRIDPRDENGRRVYLYGFDPTERLTRHFVRLVRPGDCVLDVGANVGYFTLVAALLAGPAGEVHAFEPSPQVLPQLQSNAALNPQLPIVVHAQAVVDRCGTTSFHTAPAERTGYSSIRPLDPECGTALTVPTVSLDSVLPSLPSVRLVKIDVEGAETLVLQGMVQLIARDQPFIITEIDDSFLRALGSSAPGLCARLVAAGYDLHRIIERGVLQPLSAAPLDRCNILAAPRTAEGAALSR